MPANIPYILGWNEHEMRISTTRSDLQPEYQGYSEPETPTSDNKWTIYKYTYGASGDITRRQIMGKIAWDDRTTVFPA